MGRGGNNEDSNKIRFSSDEKHVLLNPTKIWVRDYHTFIYNTVSSEKQTIIPATQAEWLDNNRIIYRKVKEGLYIYDMNSRKEGKINEINNKNAYLPKISNSKIIYTDLSKAQLWLYDLNSKKNMLLLDNATEGLRLTPTKIIYQEVEPCIDGLDRCFAPFKSKGVGIFDLKFNKKIDSIPGLKSMADIGY